MTGTHRINVGPHDRLVLDGVSYRRLESDEHGHVFDRVGQPGATLAMSHGEFAAAVLTTGYRHEPDFYAPSRAKAFLRSGVHDISYLPREEQARIRWRLEYALRFVQGERNRGFSRSKAGYNTAAEVLAGEVQALQARGTPGTTTGRADAFLPRVRKAPSGRTLRRDVERLEPADWNPTVLRRNTRKSGNTTVKVDPQVASFLEEGVKAYLSLRGPSKAGCLEIVHDLIERHNERVSEDDWLTLPSQSTLDRRIAKVRKCELVLAREGVETAEASQRALSAGLDVKWAGQRVEIDHWSMPLMVLLREMGLTQDLTAKEAKKLERMTVVVCIVFDRASRCVLGLSLAANPTTANALSAMELAVSPKDAYARAVGAKHGWKMCCTPDSVVHDAGNEFIDITFRTRVIDLRSSAHTAMAGKPSQRGGLERLNGALGERLLPWLRGRTFANPVQRGKYDSKKQANLLVEEARDVLLLFILSVYHHKGHKGLGGRVPAREWDALASRFGLAAPPDRDRRRHIFGVEMSRKTGPHGVTLLGLQYTSPELQEHFRDRGPCKVVVRVDPLDLGALSLCVPESEDWLVIDCRTGGFDQVSMSEWEKAARKLQQDYGREAALTQSVVDAALASIRAVSERHLPALGLGADRPTRELIEAVEHSIQIGFAMPADREARPVKRSLIDGGIPRGSGAPPQARPASLPAAPEGATGRAKALPGPVRPKSVAVTQTQVPPAEPSDGSKSPAADASPVAQDVTESQRPKVERRSSFQNIGTWRVKDDGE